MIVPVFSKSRPATSPPALAPPPRVATYHTGTLPLREVPVRGEALALTGIAGVLLASLVTSNQSTDLRVTCLYDNTAAVSGTQADWGFACLVEAHGHAVLFDTGTKPEILRHDVATLKVDVSRAQALGFSHEHGDHTMGVRALPAMPGLPVSIGEHFRLPPPAAEALTRIGAKRIAVGTEGSAEGLQASR